MRNHSYYSVTASLLLLFLFGCTAADEEIPDVSGIAVRLEVERLEQAFFRLESPDAINQFLEERPQLAKEFFYADRYPNRGELVRVLHGFLKTPENDTLYQETQQIFGDFQAQTEELENAFRFVKHYFPQVKVPKIYTMVSGFSGFGFGQDIFFGSDFIVIGLDFFAGKQCSFRPPDLPNYIVSRLEPEYIVPNLVKLYSSVFNAYNASDKQMLADIIFYGKALYFTDKVLPHHPDSLIIGYSGQELSDARNNEVRIWKYFLENNLLYETNNFVKTKFVGERPRIFEIGETCPGRIGRYLGWQVLRSYMAANPDATLATLMQQPDAQWLFQRSKFRPRE